MKFTPLYREGVYLGHEARSHGAHLFFGSAQLAREDLPTVFPEYEFAHLRQVHGREVITVSAPSVAAPEGDAHWTERSGVALVVQTADCLPILVAGEVHGQRVACAIHAGWRGLEQDIVGASLARAGLVSHQFITALGIGPHIRTPNFEIGADVAEQLQRAWQRAGSTALAPIWPGSRPGKFLFDLDALARAQIRAVIGGNLQGEFPTFSLNTYTSPQHHSFRRSGGGGRQWSFVALTR